MNPNLIAAKQINIRCGLCRWTIMAILLCFLSMAGVAQAQLVTNITIYQDNFARTGLLNGSAPDTVNTPGATWFACNNSAFNAQLLTDGSEIALTNSPGTTNGIYLNGFLPFVPQVGHIYTLSCQIRVLSGGNQWLAMGFATQPLTNNFFASVSCGAGWMLVRGNGTGVQPYRFPGGSGNVAQKAAAFGTTTNLFTVVLDTTTGTGAARGWTYKFFTNSVQVDSYSPANVNPTMIQYVGIGADAAQGDFQQFTLTDVLMRQGTPAIVEQPANRTSPVGQAATFWVGVTNDYPSAAYQWMTNGVAIGGATNASYTTPVLDMSYNSLNYSVVITNALFSTNSATATLTVVSAPPTVYSATKTASPTNILVAFSKAVDPVTGLNPANYALQINGAPSGISILSASYGSVSNSVVLTTSTLNTNVGYYLTVQNVKDLFGNTMSGVANVPVLPAGLVLFVRGDSGVVLDANNNVVQWLDQTTNGNNASQFFGFPSVGIVGSAARPAMNVINNGQPSVDFGNQASGVNILHWLQAPSSPSLSSMISNTTMYAVADFASTAGNDLLNKTWGNLPAPFDWDPSTAENVQYGNGFNNAPASGTGNTISANIPYVLSSTIQLPRSGGTTNFSFFLNGNGNGSNSIRAVTGTPAGIYDGGQPLWIGGRSDLQAANPKMRGQIAEIMLFNTTLSGADLTNVDNYLGQKYFPFTISQNLPATLTSSNGFSVTYSFTASQGSVHGYSFQWQENGTNIPGATGSTYATPILAPADNNDTFDVVVTLPNGSTTNSVTSTLTVLRVPPTVVSAGIPIWNTNQIVILFDEAVDPATATVAGNYALNNGATVFSAAIGDAPNKVVLTTSSLTWNANPGFYALTVSNVKDLYNNTIVTASPGVGLYPPAALWIKANTAVTTDANGVSEWDDQSGNQNDLFNISGSEPQLITNATGHPVIRFNGTNATQMDASSAPTLAITGDMSVVAVMNFATFTGNTNGNTIISKTGSGSAHQANVPAPYDYFVNFSTGSSSTPIFLRGNGSANGSSTATNGVSIGVPQILLVSESGNTVSHVLNGNSAGVGPLSGNYSETADTDAGQDLTIGARGDGFTRLTGDITEMILIGSSLSSNDVVSLNNYLSAKYGVPVGTNSYALITQQPVSNTNIDFNTTLTISAGASGNPLALQWYDTNGVAVAGQTSATLTINNDQTSDAYYLVASNAYGSVTSSIVSVTVISGLTVGLGPSMSLYVGQPWTFTAQAFGNVPLYYQWYQAGSPILNATNATYTATATLGSIAYSCIVTNGYNGYTSTNAGPVTLTGIAPPTNAFSQAVLSDHPIAYWRLNEPSGSAIAYDYVSGYNGTYGADTTNGLPGVPFAGASGELSVAMDSSDSSSNTIGHVTTPGINLITNNVTLVSWVFSFTNQVNPSGLFFLRDGNNANVFGSQVGASQYFDYTWANNSATYNYGSGLVVPTNIWALTALAITPSNATLYCFSSQTSGNAVNSVANPPQSFASGFALGADGQAITSNRTFNGKMDEVALFNYTMSASQLQQLYTAATTGVFVSVNTNPTNIVFSVTNNQLVLSWPADHTGWRLQAQTNNLSVGIGTNWVTVGGSTGTNQVVIPINITNGSVFYHLVYP